MKWFVWALLVVVGVVLALCFGLLIGKQRRMRNDKKEGARSENCKDMGPKATTEVSTCQGSRITNDSFVPEVPSAPPLYPPITTCDADEEPATLPPERTQPKKLCTANFSSGTLKTLIDRALWLKNKFF